MSTGDSNVNPGVGSADPNPKQDSSVKPVENQNDSKFVELQTKVDTLTRQYTASSEEAIRLKKENEKLSSKLEEASKPRSKPVSNDESFKQLVEEKGTVGAIEAVIESKLGEVVTKVDKIFEKETLKVIEHFKSQHPGMTSVSEKFHSELTKVMKVYSDISEAMEAAYRIVGGLEADSKATDEIKNKQDQNTLVQDADKQKQQLVSQVSGGSGDRRPVPSNPLVELETKIKALTDKAILYSVTGKTKQNLEVQAEIETLKAELRKKQNGS